MLKYIPQTDDPRSVLARDLLRQGEWREEPDEIVRDRVPTLIALYEQTAPGTRCAD